MSENRYCLCDKCNKTFQTKSKQKKPRHSNCGGYGREITPEEFEQNKKEITPEEKEKKDSFGIVEITLEETKDEIPIAEAPTIQEAVVQGQGSLIGAGVILAENLVFAISGKMPLSDTEKHNIRNNADRLAQKYPKSIASLPYGEELEFAESATSPLLSRFRYKPKKKKEKEEDDSI